MKQINFEPITLRLKVSSRGGGIEIDLSSLGFKGERMAAYQNYLGGGLLGAVCVNDTVRQKGKPFITEQQTVKLMQIGEQLKKYYHSLTNPDPDEQPWESQTFEQNQNMPVSGY